VALEQRWKRACKNATVVNNYIPTPTHETRGTEPVTRSARARYPATENLSFPFPQRQPPSLKQVMMHDNE